MSWPEIVVLVIVGALIAVAVYLVVKKGEIPWEKIKASEDKRRMEEAAAETETETKIRAILEEKERKLHDLDIALENATAEEKEQFDEVVRELAADVDVLRGRVLSILERGIGETGPADDARGGRFSGGGSPEAESRTEGED